MCYTCFRVCMTCLACPNCSDMTFCSVDCKNRNQIHKFECGTFHSHLQHELRFEIKALLIAIVSFSNVDDLIQFVEDTLLENSEKLPMSLNEDDLKSKYHFFFKLNTSAPHDFALKSAYIVYEYAISLPKIHDLFNNDRKMHFLMHLIMHHCLNSKTNSDASENSKFVGYVSSLLNHSCAPNVISLFLGNSIICVTGRPIQKGEQLFTRYSYSNRNSPTNDWGFDCKCEKCEPTRAPLDRYLITSDPCYKYILKNQINIDEGAAINQQLRSDWTIFYKKCIKLLNKYGRSACLCN